MPTPSTNYPPHPMSLSDPDPARKSGACGMRDGDRVFHLPDSRTGRADEFLQDGDALVTWDDGTYDTVKWNNLIKEEDVRRSVEVACRVVCEAQGTAQCAAICLSHFSTQTTKGQCPEAVLVWGHKMWALVTAGRLRLDPPDK